MRQALVLGTGGHCRAILSILAARHQHKITAVVELGSLRKGERIMGVAVLPNPDNLLDLCDGGEVDIFLAIGNNDIRKHWWEKIKGMGLPMPNLVSPNALVDDSAILGESNVICANAFIGPQSELGNNNLINTAAIVEHEVIIGHHCHLAPSSTIAGRSLLGDSCLLGAGAVIVDRVSVATRTVIGAGATLIRTIDQPDGVYIGTPAKRGVMTK